MNRIWVGTVDDIDKTYVELKAKKIGWLAPLKKINSPQWRRDRRGLLQSSRRNDPRIDQQNVAFILTDEGYSHG